MARPDLSKVGDDLLVYSGEQLLAYASVVNVFNGSGAHGAEEGNFLG